MAKQYWDLIEIEVARGKDTLCSLTAVMDGPAGILRVPITVNAILNYTIF